MKNMIEGLELRKSILEKSLFIEKIASTFLGQFLDIKNIKESKTLSNKSSSFSFSQKIALLMDMNLLNNTEKKKFDYFMQIRNQFMHNADAKSFVDCMSYLEGIENGLLKLYKPNSKDLKEVQLKYAVEKLSNDVLGLMIDLLDKLKEKWKKDSEKIAYKESFEAFTNGLTEFGEYINQYFNGFENYDDDVKINKLKDIGKKLSQKMVLIWGKNYKLISNKKK